MESKDMNTSNIHSGLNQQQIEESRTKHGANILTPPAGIPIWKRFLEKIGDPLILILLIAGALSVGISCYEFFSLGQSGGVFVGPAGLVIASLLAAGLAFAFELKADREFALLNQVNDN